MRAAAAPITTNRTRLRSRAPRIFSGSEAELEAGELARTHDEHRQHRLGFRFGVALAAFFVALDTLPANLAAQAFGLDQLPTWGITAVIVGALGAGMWAVTHYRTGAGRAVTVGALAVGLVAIGALRYWFLWVTAGDPLSAVLEAVALTVFTTMMVWLGILVLITLALPVVSNHLAAPVERRYPPLSVDTPLTVGSATLDVADLHCQQLGVFSARSRSPWMRHPHHASGPSGKQVGVRSAHPGA